MIGSILLIYPLIIVASIAIYVPFLFVFQLIADQKLGAGAAVKASAKAAWQNLGGVIYFLIAVGFISVLAMIPCYIPAIFLMPITIGSTWILYQDIFGREPSLERPVGDAL